MHVNISRRICFQLSNYANNIPASKDTVSYSCKFYFIKEQEFGKYVTLFFLQWKCWQMTCNSFPNQLERETILFHGAVIHPPVIQQYSVFRPENPSWLYDAAKKYGKVSKTILEGVVYANYSNKTPPPKKKACSDLTSHDISDSVAPTKGGLRGPPQKPTKEPYLTPYG